MRIYFSVHTKFKGWSPLLSPVPSSESDVMTSELTKEGPGEFEGVDFLVERSKGCSLFEGRHSSLGSSLVGEEEGFHLGIKREVDKELNTGEIVLENKEPDPGDLEPKRLPPLELCECGGLPSRRSRARLF